MATVNNIPAPADLMMAQYSLPFCVALAHHRERARSGVVQRSRRSTIRRSASLASRVTISVADEAKHGHTIASTVTVTLKDGRALTRRVDSFKGTPEQPLDRAEMREKFLLLTAALRSRGDGAAVRAAAEHRERTQPRLDQGRRGEATVQQGAATRRQTARRRSRRNERQDRPPAWCPPNSSPSPTRRSVSPTAAWSRSRPRRSMASAPTPPTAPRSRGSMPPRAGRRSIR